MKMLLAVLMTALSSSVAALDLELAAGRSQFCCLQDGVWWQSPFGFTGTTTDGSVEVGLRQRWGDFSFHGAYLDMGRATGRNLATMRDDEFGKAPSKSCNQDSQRDCLGYFVTSQQVTGVLLGGAYGRDLYGIRLEGEYGQFFYTSDLNVSIWCPNCGTAGRYSFGHGGVFSSISEIRRTPYAAARVTYKNVTLTYRRFTNVDGNGERKEGVEAQFATGLTNGPVNQIMLGISL